MRCLAKRWFQYTFILVVFCSLTACAKSKAAAGENTEIQNQSPIPTEIVEEPPMPDAEQEEMSDSATSALIVSKQENISECDWIETQDEYEAARYKSNGELEVSVERTSRPITNEKGEILAQVYYERPVVSGDTEAARKINEFYEREEQEWFDGYGRNTFYIEGYYSYFYNQFKGKCERYGENDVVEHPSRYTIKTRIMLLDENLLSVLQINDVCNEPTHFYYLGSTFDLETGELLSIDELADIDADRLKMIINDVLCEDNTYDELKGDNYLIHSFDEEIAMDYEYYYDGEKFYIILNIIEGSLDGVIATWNGKWGDEYAVGRFSYFIQPDGEMLKKTVCASSAIQTQDSAIGQVGAAGGRLCNFRCDLITAECGNGRYL